MERPAKGLAFEAPRDKADQVHRRLLELGAIDPARRSGRAGSAIVFPLRAEHARVAGRDPVLLASGRLVETGLPTRTPRAPMDAVRLALGAAGWTAEALAALPDAWDLVGDVALVKLPVPLPDEGAFGQALATALRARAVLEDLGVQGPLRTPRTRRIWGDADTRTVHTEHGVRFVLDPARVMFASGNVNERARLLHGVGPGETVVDLFAGVGYFTLPMAVHAGCRVHACEVNPEAAAFLRDGVALNDVADRVTVHEGDCRTVAPRAVADRVLMGYIHGTLGFVRVAMDALSPAGGVLHVHETATVDEGPAGLARRAVAAVRAEGRTATVRSARRVKRFAPGVLHAVVDLEVAP